ncbi:hypothetical protein [Vibrio gallaecicus]|uniref:HNH endonuclease n=1 Tax=Vibrio gallaecicus TaxID=552386 RepID=A0ABV4NCP0_9VIBR
MKCKLCLEKEDIQISHVIPDAFFRFVKDKSSGNNDNKAVGKYIEISTSGNKLAQNSYAEPMLCRDCEQNFSKEFESYVVELTLRNPKKVGAESHRSKKQLIYRNLDYRKVKLFQMSLLWRAAICSLDFYEHVSLNTETIELLRSHLVEMEPLQPNQFPCFMDRVFIDTPGEKAHFSELKPSKSLIVKPKKTSYTNLNKEFITFMFGGFEWRFWLSSCSDYYVNEGKVVNLDGSLVCPIQDIGGNHLLLSGGVLARGNEKSGKGLKRV